jgi:integrase
MPTTDHLTDPDIRNAKPKEKPYKLADGGGLFLLVNASGSKYWRMKYRYAGKEKLLALGVYPDVTLKQARKKREDARRKLDENIDPGEQRKAEAREKKLAAVNSFETVAREWYAKQLHTWVKTHSTDVLRRLEGNIFPAIGPRPIAKIDAPELLATVRKIEARGAYDLAHRVLAVCGQVFRYGIATGRCSRDISADLRGALTPHKAKHQAAVRPEELPELMRSIATYDETTGDTLTRLALQLLAETFVRTSELIGALWEEFDTEAALWVIPAGRMKMKTEHIVPLSKQALAILEQLRAIGGGSRFLFPGRNRDKPISNNTMLYALYRLGYKGKMTGHGFRAVASTIMNESGLFRPDVIERQLAHCERDEVRGAYNRAEYLPERRKLMQWWADHLVSIEAENVLPFKAKAA